MTPRGFILASILFLSICNLANAQSEKGKSIDISIGYGVSFPYDDVDTMGNGFFANGEYAVNLKTWFSVRPYAGIILTYPEKNQNQENLQEFEVTSKALLLGGKVRLTAPIPWVSPYIEGGIGMTLGSLKTYTPFTYLNKEGVLVHFPFTIGLAIGPKHDFEVEFTYFIHPDAEQISGALAIGISLPLN